MGSVMGENKKSDLKMKALREEGALNHRANQVKEMSFHEDDFFDPERNRNQREDDAIRKFSEDMREHGGAYLPYLVPCYFMDCERTVDDFEFTVTVEMPTDIVESNATVTDGNKAEWQFSFLSFLFNQTFNHDCPGRNA